MCVMVAGADKYEALSLVGVLGFSLDEKARPANAGPMVVK